VHQAYVRPAKNGSNGLRQTVSQCPLWDNSGQSQILGQILAAMHL
jgi:hypothetical protein